MFADKAKIGERTQNLVGALIGLRRRDVLQQHAKLIAAKSRQTNGVGKVGFEYRCNRAQQVVAGLVATGVVDNLELIQVDQQQRVRQIRDHGRWRLAIKQAR